VISLEKVRVSFPHHGGGRLSVLDIGEWSVERGQKVALMGPSGSGKSTLLNVLAGLIPADSGCVYVADAELGGLSELKRDRFRARHIGFVFQSFHLLDGFTALENIELGASFAGNSLEQGHAEFLLEAVGLSPHAKFFPSQLSTGQQARVALARALAGKPDLLLADEPTGSLDLDSGKQVLDLMFQTAEQEGITIVCATHDLELAGQFDHFYSMQEGGLSL